MTKLRAAAKSLLYGKVPAFRGRFRYFGETVHFPLGSLIFERACQEGVYERAVVDIILGLVEPETTYIDVGANIGLLSIPVLSVCPTVKVLSVEPSPDTLPFLNKTRMAARRSQDWTVVGAAVGSTAGEAEFWSSGAAMGAYDGLRDTGRGGRKQAVRVPIRTLDDIWREQGRPAVSLIKMDIEGGECQALRGARELISHARPVLVIEWSRANLAAYDIEPERLLPLCAEMSYAAYACPSLTPVSTKALLKLMMARTETFLLAPREAPAR